MGLIGSRSALRERLQSVVRPLFRLGLQSSPFTTAKLRPLGGGGNSVMLAPAPEQEVPPPDMWEGYSSDVEGYLSQGKADMDAVLALLARHGLETPRVALDLGCSAGRMIRHFPRTQGSEIWGADISAPHIYWCQQNLRGINFVALSTAPHLPFAGGHFDFVMCASVFTHITDLADAWLLEIRRVLKPGGHAYVTVHDKRSFEELTSAKADANDPFCSRAMEFRERHHPLKANANMFFFGSDPFSQVFYDREYLTAKWSRWMEVLAYDEMFHHYQSALLLRKRIEPA